MEFKNYAKAIFLLDESKAVRALMGAYESHDKAPQEMLKTFDSTIKIDDLVVVPSTTRHGMTVIKVTEVDVPFDIEKQETCKWIVCKIEQESYAALVEQEAKMVGAIKRAKKKAAERDIKAALLDGLAESDLLALPKIEIPAE